MEEKNYTGLIPGNETGVIIDSAASEEFRDVQEAKAFYETVKNRLLAVNDWDQLAGVASAAFQLVDKNGQEVNRSVQVGDYFKIDIPGPGSGAGQGYDWVQVEDLKEVSQQDVESVGLRVRPSTNPLTPDDSIAHFYSADSTSTFIVTRENNKITATIYDRNTKPNTETGTVVDKIRDVAAGVGAILGGSKMQWKGLATGLVSVK
ncbi:MAG: hypothetical protein JWR18_3247 [Segetibacter sp.]|jgi:hypothetical protein|nr:hypothetical protein [Segetibacter sp.]